MINIQSSHVFRSTCMGTPRCRENSHQFVNSTYTASEHGVICLSSIMLTRASEALTEQSAVCQVIYGKITLCDLAGSERPKKSEVSPRPGSGFRLCLPLSRGLLHYGISASYVHLLEPFAMSYVFWFLAAGFRVYYSSSAGAWATDRATLTKTNSQCKPTRHLHIYGTARHASA